MTRTEPTIERVRGEAQTHSRATLETSSRCADVLNNAIRVANDQNPSCVERAVSCNRSQSNFRTLPDARYEILRARGLACFRNRRAAATSAQYGKPRSPSAISLVLSSARIGLPIVPAPHLFGILRSALKNAEFLRCFASLHPTFQ